MRISVLAVGLTVLTAVVGCMVTPPTTARGLIHGLLIAAVGVLLVVLIVGVRQARRHRAIATGLARLARPGRIAGHDVGLVPGLDAAVVAGLRQPVIYCGGDLTARLDQDEVRAVILHERHHQLAGAPVRLVLLGAVGDFLRTWQRGRAWLERERARIEIAADSYAVASGVSRSALASAMLKLSSAPPSTGMAGFATAAEWRIRALVGEPTGLEIDRSATIRTALAGLGLAVACLAVYFR